MGRIMPVRCTAFLNLLAFLWHGILMLLDGDYQRARASVHWLDGFFNYLRAALRMAFHEDWQAFLVYVLGEDPD